jgi:hypothetical protein
MSLHVIDPVAWAGLMNGKASIAATRHLLRDSLLNIA